MAACVNKLMVVVSLLMLVTGGGMAFRTPLFDDEMAGSHVNDLSDKGIALKITWRERFLAILSDIEDTLTRVENTLDSDYSGDSLVNLTDYAMNQMDDVVNKLDQAEIKVDNLGLNNTEDGLVGFLRSYETGVVDVGDNYDPAATVSGTFTAPQYGLYQVTVRTTIGSGVYLQIVRNGNEILSSLSHDHYFNIKTRINLVWLDPNDQIYLTGGSASYFGVMLLRVQALTPSVG